MARGRTVVFSLVCMVTAWLFAAQGEAACTGSNPTWTTTNDESSIRTCVTAANGTGGTVTVASGTFSWTGDLVISGMTLTGTVSAITFPVNPTNDTLPTNLPDRIITGGTLVCNRHSSLITRSTGFQHSGTTYQKFRFQGADTNNLCIMDNSYVQYGTVGTAGQQSFYINTNGSLIHHVVFDWLTVNAPGSGVADVSSVRAGSWSDPFTAGALDTTGTKNNYVEDSWIGGAKEIIIDCDDGGRVVFRHNNFIDSGFTAHGGGNGVNDNDTSLQGCRFFEAYDNRFVRINNNNVLTDRNMSIWIWMRGALLVFRDNAMDDVNIQSYSGKQNIRLGVGCTGFSYPEEYQVGQTTTTPTTPPTNPVIISGNSAGPHTDATATATFPAVVENNTAGGHLCATPGTFIQSGRDYMTTNTWHTKFTYPHPAQSGGGGGGGAPALTVSGNTVLNGNVNFQ